MAVKKEGTSGKSGSQAGRKKQRAPTQDPIIITGGSVKLEYANKTSDGFVDNGSGGGKKKLKHKKNSTGPVVLTVVEIVDTKGVVPTQRIDLRALGISGNCTITINYDL